MLQKQEIIFFYLFQLNKNNSCRGGKDTAAEDAPKNVKTK